MTPKKRRLFGIISFILPLGFGVFFLLSALNSNIVYFIDPTELISEKKTGQRLRLGGLVKSHSIEIIGTKIQFQITDGNNSVTVNYNGSLPSAKISKPSASMAKGKYWTPCQVRDLLNTVPP